MPDKTAHAFDCLIYLISGALVVVQSAALFINAYAGFFGVVISVIVLILNERRKNRAERARNQQRTIKSDDDSDD